MKPVLLLALVTFPLGAFAVDVPTFKFQPPFNFPKWENGQVPKSLEDSASITPTPAPVAPPSFTFAPSPVAKTISRMPIVPAPDVDPKMVHAPKPGIDYKLIVVTPTEPETKSK